LQERRRILDRRAGSFVEDEHARVDAVLAFHRGRLGAILASWPIGAGEIIEAAASWSWLDPSFAEALHAAVDAHEFPAGTRAAWQAEQQTIARQISRREAELQLRLSEAEAREAEQKKAAAEKQLAAIET
jgi:hypothetical protein